MILLGNELPPTFDTPALIRDGGVRPFYREYEAQLRKENRSSEAEYLDLDAWAYSQSGTVLVTPRQRHPFECFTFQIAPLLEPRPKFISLAEARNIALEILHVAEARRRLERDLEAKYWESLGGEE